MDYIKLIITKLRARSFQILKHHREILSNKGELLSLFFLLINNSYSLSSFKLKSLLLLHSFAFVLVAGYYYSRENETKKGIIISFVSLAFFSLSSLVVLRRVIRRVHRGVVVVVKTMDIPPPSALVHARSSLRLRGVIVRGKRARIRRRRRP